MTFVINRWVRGGDFFGRQDLLQTLRRNVGKPLWVLGNRRVGKTSLLRQIVWLCKQGQWSDTQAIYWDLQGAGTIAGLKDSFLECLEDHPEIVATLGLEIDSLEELAFGQILSRFRRRIKSATDQARFLLLVDECEELVDISKKEPQVLSWFRKLGLISNRFSIVLAGSLRFMDLDESHSRTSPMMPDYLPPLPLGPFLDEQTHQLLERNGLQRADTTHVHDLTFGNPHLVQVVGELYLRLKTWPAVLREMRHNRVTKYFFQSNFQCLPEAMRDWFTQGKAVEELLNLKPGELHFDYAFHSSLLRVVGEGELEVNPLLRMELGQQSDFIDSSSMSGTSRSRSNGHWENLEGVLNMLKKVSPPLTTLPTTFFETYQIDLLVTANNPPSLEFMASLGETKARMIAVLGGASPEYVLEHAADARTAVYLFGLFLYHRCFGVCPFSHESEPWTYAGNLADCDVAIDPEQAQIPMSPKLAMILMRCLRADPQLRYAGLDTVIGDLAEVIHS